MNISNPGEDMRSHRFVILTVLAGLTLLFFGTGVYAFWSEGMPATANNLKRISSWQREAPEAVYLTVQETGIAAVSIKQLYSINLHFESFSAGGLSLTRNGEPVALYVDGAGADAMLYFFAEAVTNTLEAPTVYRLSAGQGVAIAQRNAWPTGPGEAQARLQYQGQANRLLHDGDLSANRGQVWFSSDAPNVLVHHASKALLVFDVTDRDNPVLLTNFQHQNNEVTFAGGRNAHYFITERHNAIQPIVQPAHTWKTSLRQKHRGADYIAIIADVEDFATATQPLLDYRRQQGLRVVAVSLDQVYHEFGHGRRTPAAIRSFLAYAYNNWQAPPPRYVLLVGDASHDVSDQMGGKNKNLLPAPMIRTGDGYVASDSWFTQSNVDPALYRLAIGRFPVQTASQLQTLVYKTVAYEMTDGDGWLHRALLIADDDLPFKELTQTLAGKLDDNGYQVHGLEMTHYNDARFDIMDAVNQGVGLLNYIGHGDESVWGAEVIFRAEDAWLLANAARLPIYTTFTCLNGMFTHPQSDSLAESLLWVERGGIVAAVAPSGQLHDDDQEAFSTIFYQHLLNHEVETLGEALQQAKVAGAANPTLYGTFKSVNLLGDPALRLRRP